MAKLAKVAIVAGTRPEAIKVAPVIQALKALGGTVPVLISTGQHREQLTSALDTFELVADFDLDVMTDRQTLPELASRIIARGSDLLQTLQIERVVVQGDTMSAYCMAFAAFLNRIPIVHIEAGLRSYSLDEPFPEEAARRLISVVSALDLPPTPAAQGNLVREGKSPDHMVVTGQTAVDAIRWAAARGTLPLGLEGRQMVTVTMHRRENWPALRELAIAVAHIAEATPDLTFVYPLHLNPAVREAVTPPLQHLANVVLTEPLEYTVMARLLMASEFAITDSGGLQEECVSLGVPVFVLRNVTERPEGLAVGAMRLLGSDAQVVEESVLAAIRPGGTLHLMRGRPNPYGDGRAGERCAQAILWDLGLSERPVNWSA